MRREAPVAQAGSNQPFRTFANGPGPAHRPAYRRAVAIDVPRVRHKVHGVQGGRPARLPERLRGLPARARTSPAADSPGGAAQGQDAAPRSAQPRPATRTGTITSTTAESRRGRTVRRGRSPPRFAPAEGLPRMNLETLTHTCGEWLKGSGPESDIVISSRIRLARNLAAFPFGNRANTHQKAEIEASLRERLPRLELQTPLNYISFTGLSPLDRQFLVERQLVSRELANADGPRGVALGAPETMSVTVNEEDHLGLQVMRSGFTLDEAWQDIVRLDDLIEQKVSYAFSEEFGYLTACPTNVGTGMRASVMPHLPALVLTKQIEKVSRALQKINLAVRGLYGEGSRASGDFYQISNQVTLGKSETTILTEIREVIPQIITYERQARQTLTRESRQALHDKVSRAFGTLCSATMMTSEETMDLLSSVRLGVNLGLIEDVSIPTVNELFIHTQPAHLQKLMGASLDGEERNAARARYLSNRLRENGQHLN